METHASIHALASLLTLSPMPCLSILSSFQSHLGTHFTFITSEFVLCSSISLLMLLLWFYRELGLVPCESHNHLWSSSECFEVQYSAFYVRCRDSLVWFMVDKASLHSWILLFSWDLCTRSVMVNTHVLNLLKLELLIAHFTRILSVKTLQTVSIAIGRQYT